MLPAWRTTDCQTCNHVHCMQDMLGPKTPGHFTLRDLRRGRALAGAMFNILFNLGKFVAYETRDPFVVRQERAEEPEATDWDRCVTCSLMACISTRCGALLLIGTSRRSR